MMQDEIKVTADWSWRVSEGDHVIMAMMDPQEVLLCFGLLSVPC